MKNTFFVKTTASPITTTQRVFYPLVNIILLGEIVELLHKLDRFCFTYQHVDCLYTLFKYWFSGKIIAKSGIVFDNVQRAISFNQRSRGMDKMPSNAKQRFLRKKFKQNFMSALQKIKSTQTSCSLFAERIEKTERTKFGLELKKKIIFLMFMVIIK